MPAVSSIRVHGISDVLRRLDSELGDNGKVYRRTVKAIKDAGKPAVNHAIGYLPAETNMPRGFTHKNVRGWAVSRTDRDRAFPRYDLRAAKSSIRVVSARERSVRTDNGWRAGKMFGIAIEMRDPAASIYDVAGNGRSRRQLAKRSSDPRSERFNVLMRNASWLPPAARFRVLLPAVIDTRPEIVKSIWSILEDARRHLDAQRDMTWSSIK